MDGWVGASQRVRWSGDGGGVGGNGSALVCVSRVCVPQRCPQWVVCSQACCVLTERVALIDGLVSEWVVKVIVGYG